MKIEIESFYGDKVLFNDKNYMLEDIKEMYANCLVLVKSRADIPEKMSTMYNFKIKEKILSFKTPKEIYDYCIDIDTDYIYKPNY